MKQINLKNMNFGRKIKDIAIVQRTQQFERLLGVNKQMLLKAEID